MGTATFGWGHEVPSGQEVTAVVAVIVTVAASAVYLVARRVQEVQAGAQRRRRSKRWPEAPGADEDRGARAIAVGHDGEGRELPTPQAFEG
ncbi:MAG: hypothetical protein M0Z34_06760 [Nitrospiraceae bacterium]|nr:hypothetical protein [Nitrospiraceae bacterium]